MSAIRIELGLAALLLLAGAAPSAAQQSVEELTEACGGSPGTSVAALCANVALAAQALQAGVGWSHAGGAALTGSASTLGRRFGRTPRVGMTGELGLTRFPMPGFFEGGEATTFAVTPVARARLGVGVFDGFSPAPTVGGFLALDLVGSVSWAFLPGGKGFQDDSQAWSYGLRLGLLRESFTLPGVTLSVVRSHTGTVELGEESAGRPRVAVDVTTTSVRAVVGKEFLALGLKAGVGWDRYSSDGSVTRGQGLSAPPTPQVIPPTVVSDLESDRFTAFGGVTRTFLVWQMGVEVGWARGPSGFRPVGTDFDPSRSSLFLAASLRLTV